VDVVTPIGGAGVKSATSKWNEIPRQLMKGRLNQPIGEGEDAQASPAQKQIPADDKSPETMIAPGANLGLLLAAFDQTPVLEFIG
jgi:hypothetical protein